MSGDGFNSSLQAVHFPESLEHLAFGARFNQSLRNVLGLYALQNFTFFPELCTLMKPLMNHPQFLHQKRVANP